MEKRLNLMERAKRDVIDLIDQQLLTQSKGAYYMQKIRLIRDNIKTMDLKNVNTKKVEGLSEVKS